MFELTVHETLLDLSTIAMTTNNRVDTQRSMTFAQKHRLSANKACMFEAIAFD
jgi:hypothetical protein